MKKYFISPDSTIEKLFECKEMTELSSGLCIFHDSNYLLDDSQIRRTDVINKLRQKIHQDRLKCKKVECIGYYIPDIEFSSVINENFMTIRENKVDFYFQGATFAGEANFNGATFSGVADFFGATFSAEANFNGATFSGVADFFGATFSAEANFNGATFSGVAYFNGATFSAEANFTGGTFSGEAYFPGAIFSALAYFSDTKFSAAASFGSATFSGEANFRDAKFSVVDFFAAKFSALAYFLGGTFSGEANFTGGTFSGEAYFGGTFSGEAYFPGAIFSALAYFRDTKFSAAASFGSATFSGEANFRDAKFSALANFSDAKFSALANFSDAKFSAVTAFSDATFLGEAIFSDAKFSEKAIFYNATFLGEAIFYNATFLGEANFYDAKFLKTEFNTSIFSKQVKFITTIFKDLTEFHNVLFEEPEKTVFDVNDLSKVSFLNTDITRVRFSDKVRWGKKKVEFDKFWGGKKVKEERFKIVDERIVEAKIKKKDSQNTKDFNLGSIKAIYRGLRENYEYRMRYDEAGQFFIREMELKRMYREVPSKEQEQESEESEAKEEGAEEANRLVIKQNNWFKRNLFSLTGWYYHLSRYGEDLLRPTIAGIVILSLSILFFLMQNNTSFEPTLPFFQNNDISNSTTFSKFIGFEKADNVTHWLKSFERSIADFIPLLPLGGDIKVGVIDYVIKIVGGAVTFGLIAIALRRRFERKYRH